MMQAAAFLLATIAMQPPLPLCQRFPLSPSAKIVMGAHKSDASDASVCGSFRLTPAQVRQRFRTYHLTTGSEIHDKYLWLACWQEGSITIESHRFHFRARVGNLMQTNYPDGKWKQLGGPYDDDLSDGEDPHWRDQQCR